MGQAAIHTATVVGVRAVDVDVEVDVGAGLPSFAIVGLADTAVQEARERVRSAIRAAGFEVPNSRIVVNLAPGPLRKHGTGFDLPIALGILSATRQIAERLTSRVMAVGELSLDGGVRGIPGMIAYALAARDRRLDLLAPENGAESLGVPDITYVPLRNLRDLRGGLRPPSLPHPTPSTEPVSTVDYADVIGQELAVRALVIAAAGGHNVLMLGPPGSGKTMLARRLPTILPPLTSDETLETALVHSVAGLDHRSVLRGMRPFRAPHHSASIAGLVGGGTPPRPGEASLAHNGVLFLDEMPEFGPAALQCLRQPLEDRRIVLVRAEGRIAFPAGFSLVGAANPCPCGYLGDPQRECRCPPSAIDRYRARIGGPLMDRIDLVVHVERPPAGSLVREATAGRGSTELLDQVMEARSRRESLMSGQLSGAGLLGACRLDDSGRRMVERAAGTHHLSGRGVTRLLRVARTIADLDAKARVGVDHLSEALGYRCADRP